MQSLLQEIVDNIFSCKICEFHFHDVCLTRVPSRKHYLHEHEPLHFDDVPSLECSRCCTNTDSPLLRCVPCDFNIHEKCTELPLAVKHDTHDHPLTLQESYVEDDTGEYYCDLCEKRRDGRLGVYVCMQCPARWAFHIWCILPELGKVYENKGQATIVKRLDEQIAIKNKQLRATEQKLEAVSKELDEMKRELDELMKQRAELVPTEEKI